MAAEPELPRRAASLALLAAALTGLDPVRARAQNDRRVLLVLTRSARDPRINAQKAEAARLTKTGDDRDLDVVVAAVGGGSGLGGTRPFEVVLIGKDGGVKLRSIRIVTAKTLMALIDAMPMRRDEVRRRPRAGP